MIQATTPIHKFSFPSEISINKAQEILITYTQNGNILLEKRKTDLQISECNNSCQYEMTQQETAKFAADEITKMQVRVKTADGSVLASRIFELFIGRALNKETI